MFIRNRYYLLIDFLMLPLAVYLAFVMRLEDTAFLIDGSSDYAATATAMAILAMTILPWVFYLTGMYSRYWAYASIGEVKLISMSVLLGTLLMILPARLLPVVSPTLHAAPWGVLAIFFLLVLGGVSLPRLLARQRRTYATNGHDAKSTPVSQVVLIAGAGETGMMIARELARNPQLGMRVAGFVDDDRAKLHTRIYDLPVLGDCRRIPDLVPQHGITRVIIAMPTAPGEIIREIVDLSKQAGLSTQTVPGMYELLGGTVKVNQLREVQIQDLLRREPVNTDLSAVRELLRGRRVLVTGGGGSIGSELCRQVLRCEPAELVIVGHGENSVFEIYNELRATQAGKDREDCPIHPVIADIRLPSRLQAVFHRYRPQIVFHAAAHKHVPLMEGNPAEAVTNNIAGTRNVLAASAQVGVERFVMISTDKAVNPTSVMGASKRAAELEVLRAAQRTGRPYVAVRFGNVLGSRGSVVLTFKRQIAAGGPVTVTDPSMTRFFMTIPEAVQLVLQAAVLGQGGEVFMLDMGEPVRIEDLARDMIRLSGLQVGRDINIVYTGARPGEKLYEELFLEDETYKATVHEKVFIAANASGAVPVNLEELVERLEGAAHLGDDAAILRILRELVPEFRRDALPGPTSSREPAASPKESPARPQSRPPQSRPPSHPLSSTAFGKK